MGIRIALLAALLACLSVNAAELADRQREPSGTKPDALRAASATEPFDLTLENGKQYKACRVKRVLPDALIISHQDGGARIPFEKLPKAIQERYGYDPVRLAAERAAKAKGEAERVAKAEAEAEAERVAKAEKAKARRAAKAEAEKAETERAEAKKAEWEAEKAAAAKVEEDLNVDGLVLLRSTIKGTTDEYGGEITGTIVNRTGRKLRYAQISFNLYDQTDAQVGNALANITGLEPGARWSFKASAFGTRFRSFKLSEMSGL